jgi:hypothetical protein
MEQSYCWYNGSSGITEEDLNQVHIVILQFSSCLVLTYCIQYFLTLVLTIHSKRWLQASGAYLFRPNTSECFSFEESQRMVSSKF